MLKPINLILLLGLAGAGGYLAYDKYRDSKAADEALPIVTKDYEVAAPGRVEPKSGDIRLGATYLGRVEEVLVKVDDKVEEGELLLRLDDAEARAKLASAETEAEALREDREKAFASGREDVRKAEDAIYSAERAVTGARIELDYAISAKRSGTGSEAAVSDARRRLKDANERLERERIAYVKAQSKPNLPAPSRAESAVSAARAEVRMAEALLDKTRIRAPSAGTILQVNPKQGEVVAPSPDLPLVVMGDMSVVRVKAEVDEGDVGKIKLNQTAYVKSIAVPDQKFEGKVTRIAPSLGQAKIGPRGPLRPTDVEVMEVTIEMQGTATALKPGMRVDAFFRKD
ncbi:MAG: efflux RND transporter periplasmic adaptor subunit [Hyphomicrobium zavarzinii]|jgi:HlyD family secretion protein|uniref:HlyD family secretion protein n=1 Tax=Hyphomicrobium TaxID=81 RepID=UPI0003800B00|nr:MULTISPECIES: efflux RND transporter periplasmic adaptor subunit [Hyphomicrobium]MBL8847364.1 efflux RND transporter periplasmic adaptor subunit [Hyphomicrobium zavarzinii]WBT37316.1 efflux RND transporter periplasmic adaptor subunit [Hyphomicrobium sp. DMF-1]HML43100.1 efflux RND transporter periplasmic adaptor subunit [Hyphomicrobium zavarzinii]